MKLGKLFKVTFVAVFVIVFASQAIVHWQYYAWPVGRLQWAVAVFEVFMWSLLGLMFVLVPCACLAQLQRFLDRQSRL